MVTKDKFVCIVYIRRRCDQLYAFHSSFYEITIWFVTLPLSRNGNFIHVIDSYMYSTLASTLVILFPEKCTSIHRVHCVHEQ